jgi:hypothetical protein
MSMIGPDRQGPQEVLQDIQPAIETIWQVLEAAGAAAAEYLESAKLPRDPFLLSTLVRAHARQRLDAHGPIAVDSPNGLMREPLANVGLSLTYRNSYRIKILKAANGAMRPPGSHRMEDYYEQLTIFQDQVDAMNLVVIWDLAPDGTLSLKLVCPRDGSMTRSSVSVHWMIALPHPAETMKPAQVTEVADDAVLDIPIERVEDREL